MGPRTKVERETREQARRILVGTTIVMTLIVVMFAALASAQGQEAVSGWVSAVPVGNVWVTAEQQATSAKFIPFAQCEGCEGACNPGGQWIEDFEPRLVPVEPPNYVAPSAPQSAANYIVRIRCPMPGGVLFWGSGAIIESNESQSLVLTCRHVVANNLAAQQFTCQVILRDGRELEAQIITGSQDCDAALIRVGTGGLTPLPLAPADPQSGSVRAGGFGGSGTIAVVRGPIVGESRDSYGSRSLVMRASVRHGDSGGPVANDEGQLVGLIWGCDRPGSGTETYFTPVTCLRAFLDRARTKFPNVFGGCDGPQCPPRTQPDLPPPQPPIGLPPEETPNAELIAMEQRFNARIEALAAELKTIEAKPGPPGPVGPAGKNGADATVDTQKLADAIMAALPPMTVETYSGGVRRETETVPIGGTLRLRFDPIRPDSGQTAGQ